MDHGYPRYTIFHVKKIKSSLLDACSSVWISSSMVLHHFSRGFFLSFSDHQKDFCKISRSQKMTFWGFPGDLFPSQSMALAVVMDYGPWSMVHGAWTMVHGPWPLVHDPWSVVHGPWFMDHGPWSMHHCPWTMVQWSMDHGPWSVVHCPWSMVQVPLPWPWPRPFPKSFFPKSVFQKSGSQKSGFPTSVYPIIWLSKIVFFHGFGIFLYSELPINRLCRPTSTNTITNNHIFHM